MEKFKNMGEMDQNYIVGESSIDCKIHRHNLIGFQKVHPDAVIPQKADDGCTGYDLTSVEDVILKPGERKLVSTGLKWEPNSSWDMSIRPRSGMAYKYGVTVLNAPATIDASYTGIIHVLLVNHSDADYVIKSGDRIAQTVFHKVAKVIIAELEEVSETSRGAGGFGSTGK